MSGGIVRDIRTGRAIGKTRSLTAAFLVHLQALLEIDEEFYLVHGRCRHSDVREMINELKEAIGESAPIICDPRMPADVVLIFQGCPEELGFAS